MAKIDILWTDIRYTQWFNVLIDFPIKYEDFATNEMFFDIREYIEKYFNHLFKIIVSNHPNSRNVS